MARKIFKLLIGRNCTFANRTGPLFHFGQGKKVVQRVPGMQFRKGRRPPGCSAEEAALDGGGDGYGEARVSELQLPPGPVMTKKKSFLPLHKELPPLRIAVAK